MAAGELAGRLRDRIPEILRRWRATAPTEAGEDAATDAQEGYFHAFLLRLAQALETSGASPAAGAPPEVFALPELVRELRRLRELVLEALERDGALEPEARTRLLTRFAEQGDLSLTSAAERLVREQAAARERQEEHHRLLLDAARDFAFMTMDPDGKVLTWSSGAEQITGYSAAEILGESADRLFTREDRAQGAPEEERRTALVTGRAEDERWHLRKDGRRFYASGVMRPLPPANGAPAGFVKVLRDATDRKLGELRQRARFELGSVLAEAQGLADAAPRVLGILGGSTGWSFGALWALEESADALRCVSTWRAPGVSCPEFEARTRGARFRAGEGLPGTVWLSNQPVWIAEVEQSANFPRLLVAVREGLQTGFAMPIVAGRQLVGVVEFFSRDVRPAEPELVRAFEQFVGQLGQFLEHQRARASLARSEARKSAMLEAALDAIITIDREDRVLEFNPAAEAMFGYTREEALGQLLAELIVPPSLRAAHLAGMERYLTNGEARVLGRRIELPALRRDGSVFPVELTITRIPAPEGDPLFTAYLRDISERKRMEGALRDQLDFTRAVMTSLGEGVYALDHGGRISFANPAAERLLGWTQEELLGRSLHTLVHGEVSEAECALLEALRSGGRITQHEDHFVRKDGTAIPVVCSFAPLLAGEEIAGAVLTFQDISARKHAEELLWEQASLGRLGTAVSEALTGSGELEEVLQRCCEALVEHLGASVARVWRLDEAGAGLEQSASAGLESGPYQAVGRAPLEGSRIGWIAREGLPHLTNDAPNDPQIGEREWVRREGLTAFAGYPLIVEERVIGVVALFARRPLSDQVLRALASVAEGVAQFIDRKRLEEYLLLRTDQLLEADRRKNEFLATLAHELRNPLAPIRSAVELMRLRGESDPMLRRARETVERQVQQMSRLVEDLLDVARITRGTIELRRERASLTEVARHAAQTARPFLEQRRHQFVLDLPDEPLELEGDPTRLEQVVVNLLTNAAKFTPPEGRVELRLRHEGECAVLRVRDTGKGIPAEMLPQIFELFTQVNPTIDRAEGGLGLGLTLVRNLVRMHGGTVEARSEGRGRGSEFVVRLPLLPPGYEGVPAPAAGVAPGAPRPVTGTRVLVVDDNRDASETLGDLLSLWGYEVETAYSGPEALEIARVFRPDAVLLDIGLPGMDGYEVARRLRGDPELASACLLAMTGYGQEEARRRSHEAGFDQHLVKPVDPELLRKLLAPVGEPGTGDARSSQGGTE
ncbi:MAG: PAS domain S-box protein [Armatimonadota bacterium]